MSGSKFTEGGGGVENTPNAVPAEKKLSALGLVIVCADLSSCCDQVSQAHCFFVFEVFQ